MDDYSEKPIPASDSLDSLETPSTVVEPSVTPVPDETKPQPNAVKAAPGAPAPHGPRFPLLRRLLRRFNIYLLAFVLIIIIAAAVLVIAAFSSNDQKSSGANSQSLSSSALKQLASSTATVGDPKQILNVQSNAVFAGKVLVRDSLDVAGPLHIGGALSLPGITVAGTSTFDQVQINKRLSVASDTAIQGALSVQKNLSVAGGATFGGSISTTQVTTNSLQLNGDLNLTKHITAGGPTPGRSNGNALGSGGTSSVSGSDSGGSININTGSSPAAGCFITITFASKYNATPHVIVTPIGSAAAGLAYYVNRSTTSFSVCTNSAAPAGASFGFDYFVLD